MATCLVTGGAGFIGSHLVEALVCEGHTVRVLDNLSTGTLANLAGVRGRIEFIDGDVCDPATIRSVMQGIDLVFHLAAATSISRSMADPLEFHRICATGTLQVLSAALECNVRRVVYSASSSVYGDSDPRAKRESDPLVPRTPYAAAKLAGEQYCQMFHETFGLETVCLRYFHVFGPRQSTGGPYAGVIPLFIDALLDGMPPLIYGNGAQSRDFTYVENVVRGTLLAAESPAAAGKVYNIACGRSVTLLDLVETLNNLLGLSIAPHFIPPRAANFRHSHADIALARSELGYDPFVEFEDGLRRCVEQYRAGRSVAASPVRSALGPSAVLVAQGL